MRKYLFKTPDFFLKLWPRYIWRINTKEKKLYLTFDDGPHPVATPFVLQELKKYNAKATFFCIGKNVLAYSDIYQQIIDAGHAVGHHTQHHKNGWKTDTADYLQDVEAASNIIHSKLFRPPYGRMKKQQASAILKNNHIIMWSMLSGDFDKSVSPDYCVMQLMKKSMPGSIIVFHDSEKAFPILEKVLPEVLILFNEKGYEFEKISETML